MKVFYRILSRIVYWFCNQVELFVDYRSNIALSSRIGKALTKLWEYLLDISVGLYRKGS